MENSSGIYLTRGVDNFLKYEEKMGILSKMMNNDWGDTHEEDKLLNKEALKTKERIVAKYIVRGTDIFAITEAGHKITTVLLADEY